MNPNSKVLIHGGTSIVGIWTIMLARAHSCTVIATTKNPAKAERLKECGADFVLLEDELHNEVRCIAPSGVDTILELIGPDTQISFTLPSLARHGSAVLTGVLSKEWNMKNFTPADIPPTRKITLYATTNSGGLGDEDEGLDEVPGFMKDDVQKVERGLSPKELFLDRVFKLVDIGKAHEYMEQNQAVGKVVVIIE